MTNPPKQIFDPVESATHITESGNRHNLLPTFRSIPVMTFVRTAPEMHDRISQQDIFRCFDPIFCQNRLVPVGPLIIRSIPPLAHRPGRGKISLLFPENFPDLSFTSHRLPHHPVIGRMNAVHQSVIGRTNNRAQAPPPHATVRNRPSTMRFYDRQRYPLHPLRLRRALPKESVSDDICAKERPPAGSVP